jgi:putative FmdB family regulatory protein
MPKYGYACPDCGARFDLDRPMSASADPAPCPVCGISSPRAISAPKLLFKADPRDVRPVWHNHDGYSHAHAPRRGRHRTPGEDH